MKMVGIDSSSLQSSQFDSVWGLVATWCHYTFIRQTGWTLGL